MIGVALLAFMLAQGTPSMTVSAARPSVSNQNLAAASSAQFSEVAPLLAQATGSVPSRPAARPAASKPKSAAVSPPMSAAQFAELAAKAGKAREANQPDEAIALYTQAVKANPAWAEGWWWLGTTFYGQERWTDCRDAFRKFTAMIQNAGPGFALLSACEFRLGSYRDSLLHAEKGLALGLPPNDPMTAEARFYHAAALVKAGDFERAHLMLTMLVREVNASPEMVALAGLASLRRAQTIKEIRLDDREVVFRTGRAFVTAAERNGPDARALFEELVRDFPNTPNLHYVFGAFLLAGEPDRGVAELRRELEITPNHLPALVSLAMEYVKRSEPEQGLPFAKRAAAAAPGNFAARAAYGRVLLDTDHAAEGLKELEAAVKLAPDSPQVQLGLSQAYAKLGRKEEAEKARAEFARLRKALEARQ